MKNYIKGKIAESDNFVTDNPYLKRAFEFLRNADLAKLPNGRTVIDGENIYINVNAAELSPFETFGKCEAHRRYIDIQLPINGKETLGVCTLTDQELKLPFDEEKDIVFFEAPAEPIEVEVGEYVVFYPPTAGHRPNCTLETPPTGYRKAVVKVISTTNH